jgi:hypothetical protein
MACFDRGTNPFGKDFYYRTMLDRPSRFHNA